ncbi:MAG: TonB family protein, partial [Bacteroidota bacterium]
MLTYLLEVTICWSIFYLLYATLLRKETFFHTNRWYLLGTLAVGLLIPLISWQPQPDTIYHSGAELFQPIHQSLDQFDDTIQIIAQENTWTWLDILLLIYVLGAIIVGYRFLYGLFQIWQLYNRSDVQRQGDILLVQTDQEHLPFSFFNLLFWSCTFEAALKEEAQILKHEVAHIDQKHTLDLLFVEILQIVFWCSPIIYCYRIALRNTHEYLADALVLKDAKRKDYGRLLLKQSMSSIQIALANHFIQSQLKNRILMMTRHESHKRNLMKYLPLLPLLLLTVLAFSKWEAEAQSTVEATQLTDNTLDEIVVAALAASTTKEMTFIHPIKDQSNITSNVGYGEQINPFTNEKQLHTGVDYGVPLNTAVVATADGVLKTAVVSDEGFGNHIILEHADGYSTLYAHLGDLKIGKGDQKIKQGQVIALSGNTGLSTGPHLHYEIRKDGKAFDFENHSTQTTHHHYTDEHHASTDASCDPKVIEQRIETIFSPKSFNNDVVSQQLSKALKAVKTNCTEAEFEKAVGVIMSNAFMRKLTFEMYADGSVEIRRPNPKAEQLYNVVDKMPRFFSKSCEKEQDDKARKKCSDTELVKYIYSNIKYPKAARQANIQGMNIVQFVVETDGTVSDITLKRDIGGGCGEEARRVVEKMNTDGISWIPGEQNGEKVRVRFTLPIKFALQENQVQTATESRVMEDEVFKVVEEMPRFPADDCETLADQEEERNCSNKALLAYLLENTRYPKAAKADEIEGICVVQFTVETDGTLSDIDLVRDIGSGCGEEAKRVVQQMNTDGIEWIPGVQRGRTVRVRFTLPFKFALNNQQKSGTKAPQTNMTSPVDRNLQLSSFTLSPNPAAGQVRLQFSGAAVPTQIRMYQADGKIFWLKGECCGGTSNRQKIDKVLLLQDGIKKVIRDAFGYTLTECNRSK